MELTYTAFRTGDGVTLRYVDAGDGPALVLLPGLGQSAAQFAKQIDTFRRTHRVIAVDLRGHGESDKPAYGYRISRLAADLHELLGAVAPDRPTLLGHSMGSSVIWACHELFGLGGVAGLVLVDQPPAIVVQPHWTAAEAADYGAFLTPDAVFDVAERLRKDREPAGTPYLDAADAAFFAARHGLFPAEHEATLFIDHAFQDWRATLARIDTPSLVICGADRAKVCAWTVGQLTTATGRVFGAADRGSHFMFWDNAPLFNDVVRAFLERR